MDTRFSYRSRSTGSGRRRLLLATAFVILLFLIDLVTGGKVRAIVRDGAAAVSLTLHHMSAGISASGYFASHAALASENQSLKAHVAALAERAALTTALQEQVATLESLAHLAQSTPGVSAPVASSFIASPYGTFLIGAGSAEGIAPGALVLSGSGFVIGRVTDVGKGTATVVEIFAPQHSIDALIDGSPVTVKGAGGGNAIAQVPHGVTVTVGDPVTAPEFQGRPIGVVGHFDTDPSSAATQVYIGSPVNRAALQYVFVIPAQQ